MNIINWDRTVKLYLLHNRGWRSYQQWFFGIIQRSHRLFALGDVVLVELANGSGQQWPVYCKTGRGYDVVRYYMQFKRYPEDSYRRRLSGQHFAKTYPESGICVVPVRPPKKWRKESYDNRTVVCILESPDGLAKISPADPAVRAWLDSCA